MITMRTILCLIAATSLVAGFQAGATTEIFNLTFDGDLGGMTPDNDPVIPSERARDTWTKVTTPLTEVDVDGNSVAQVYLFNGNVRGISIALSSGFTPGTRYTLSARAKHRYAFNNPELKMVLAATHASAGTTGDYLMDNFYNGTEEAYQPVVTNSGDSAVSNVLTKTLNVNSSWQTVAGTFVYDGSFGPDMAIPLQCFDTDGSESYIHFDDFILSDNRAPEFTTNLIVAATGFVGNAYSQSIAAFAPDVENDTRTFEKDSGDTSWINVAANGLVTGTPTVAGTYDVTVYVWDNQGSETNSALLRIEITDAAIAPSWVLDSFEMGHVAVGQSYSDSLTGRAIDFNGDPLTYAEVGSGPAWLDIAADGTISGTPEDGDLGTNSWSVAASDGSLSSTSSFEIVVIEGGLVYEQTFTPSVELAGFFNNTQGNGQQAYVTSEVQTGMWAHTFSTNSDSYNLWDEVGLTDVLEFAEDGSGTQSDGVGTFIPASTFDGKPGKYLLTYSFVTNDFYGAVSRVGARIYEASRGTNANETSDYYLQLRGSFVFNLSVQVPGGSDAYVSPLVANDAVSDVLGSRALEFDYSGTNDVVLIFGTYTPDGRARAAIDNIRVFKLPVNYAEWEAGFGLVEGKYGDDDDDGFDNITEFGLGLDPTVPGGVDDGALPDLSKDGSDLVYVVAQRNTDGTLVFNLLTTDDLVSGSWSTNNTPAEYTVSGTGTVGAFDFVTNLIDTAADNKFWKPAVTETP